jgi:hypothetical protein
MLYDEDKNHAHHPTQRYDVQIQWQAQKLAWCPSESWSFLQVPCLQPETVTLEKSFTPELVTANLNANPLVNLALSAVELICDLSDSEFAILNIDVCVSDDPAQFWGKTAGDISVHLPYQFVKIPTPDLFTTYYWRFRTFNGEYESGWTEWSRLDRTL